MKVCIKLLVIRWKTNQLCIVINFIWRSSDRIPQLEARSRRNLEVPCWSIMHDICKKIFHTEFHTCFFPSSLFLSNWSKLDFSHIFHNNIYSILTLHELESSDIWTHCNSQQKTTTKSFPTVRQCWKVEQFLTSWRRREEFFCGKFTQSSKLLRMLITVSSGKCRSKRKTPPIRKWPHFGRRISNSKTRAQF